MKRNEDSVSFRQSLQGYEAAVKELLMRAEAYAHGRHPAFIEDNFKQLELISRHIAEVLTPQDASTGAAATPVASPRIKSAPHRKVHASSIRPEQPGRRTNKTEKSSRKASKVKPVKALHLKKTRAGRGAAPLMNPRANFKNKRF